MESKSFEIAAWSYFNDADTKKFVDAHIRVETDRLIELVLNARFLMSLDRETLDSEMNRINGLLSKEFRADITFIEVFTDLISRRYLKMTGLQNENTFVFLQGSNASFTRWLFELSR